MFKIFAKFCTLILTPNTYYFRYRIIVCVSIGQKRQQGVHVYHSFLWDPDRDVYVAHNFENCHIFANIVVYGIYLD